MNESKMEIKEKFPWKAKKKAQEPRECSIDAKELSGNNM